ncbi:MAG TPA: hypothetical protein VHS99_22430 [Chloroflexota bacterium]|nr:hypothetical protein [Chloroflexota bacterium]
MQRTPGQAGRRGRLLYVNSALQLIIWSTHVTALEVHGRTATFSGTCTDLWRSTPCTFLAVATDGAPPAAGDEPDGPHGEGRPGRGDSFRLEISGRPVEEGRLIMGQIRIP